MPLLDRPDGGAGTAVLEDTRPAITTVHRVETTTDKNRAAHIVLERGKDETAAAHVLRARVEGTPITALCGHVWVPHRQAKDLPVCQECRDIYEASGREGGHDDRGELPPE